MIRSGMFLGDRYEILEKIGSGGMADVYRARCHKLNRFVAIKILKEEFCDDQTIVKKFTEEAQAAACLSHNNIVGIYDVNEENNTHYIVMELLDGMTLKQYITQKGCLSAEETTEISIHVAEGLSAAHAQNIIHRDIKPQNIMITKDGKVKVADFGIAHMVTSNTINTVSMGSVHYSSPEQSRGGYCDARSDIYSLGVTMYEMITGIVPFDGDNVVGIAVAHANDIVVPPSKIVEGVPEDLENVILKCLEKSPENRYATANDLIADLKNTEAARNLVILPENHPDETGEQELVEEKSEMGDRLLNILMIAGGVVIILLLLYIAIRWSGIISSNNNPAGVGSSSTIGVVPNTNKDATEEESASTDSNKNVTTSMPDCLGLEVDAAEALLDEYNLVAEFAKEMEYSDEYEAGTICKQEYKKGTELDKYTKVELVISLGTDKFEIEERYIGMSKTRFEMEVKQYDLDISYKAEYNEDIARGIIYKMDPSSGKIKRGSKLTVYYSLGPQYVTVPDLRGENQTDVAAILDRYNLNEGSVTQAYSNDVEAGYVISQSLNPGDQVKAESTINYVVSLGRKTVYVPSVVGETLDNAQEILRSYELEYWTTEEYSDKYEANVVISQDPVEGTERKSGDSVHLIVSKGPEEVSFNVVGKTQKQATSELTKLGLSVASVEEEYSSEQKQGYVIAVQNADTSAEGFHKGDSVILIVSKGQEPITVPSVVGSTQASAESQLNDLGLKVTVTTKNVTLTQSEAQKKGVKDGDSLVVSQSIDGGKSVTSGTTITITVEKYTVQPDPTQPPETTTAEPDTEETEE